MIKNAVASLMVRLHHLPLPRAAPASTYRRRHHHALRLPRPASASVRPAAAAMSTTAEQAVADQKRALRTEVRRALKALSPDQRAREGQTGLAKDLYVPRVEDKNRNMRMLKITTMDDLVKNSMNILEPSPVDASGNDREDVLSASSPIDLFLLPGRFSIISFRHTPPRHIDLIGYYDTFLLKYQELAKEKGWNQPLLVALSYSVQIMEEGVIPVNSTDVPIDALVTSSGVIPISPAALEKI
ncbi:5-formyltetrahydrofolate cyclo-ligase, mitochondrial [Dichanthelium oligosanthes]|uniref:5-formyltetrahydrofolate cyclo-ligase n=1 Tax=Dichanthelium oligosanthes TaxID=888268 RepID=A0A1E5V636_9POAL|nr:5-formyltetrahydrofolate cyclo-ligase, mitochondrial [Dichanthelium oligosanthes]